MLGNGVLTGVLGVLAASVVVCVCAVWRWSLVGVLSRRCPSCGFTCVSVCAVV